jgi:O-acetylhomoserine/O-acetylserine sulfhydrylase-like pyridoxal-dependent enzyme
MQQRIHNLCNLNSQIKVAGTESIFPDAGVDTDGGKVEVVLPTDQAALRDFGRAEHGVALVSVEADAFHDSGIGKPNKAILGRWVSKVEGGMEGMAVFWGFGAINNASSNLLEPTTLSAHDAALSG